MLEMKTWNLLLPIYDDMDKSSLACRNMKREIPDILSKERFHGPKAIPLPGLSVSPNPRSIAADSIEVRQALHQYFKLFHKNHVEHAHKVKTYQS